MKEYTSCFIGIPLPEKFQPDFESLLRDVSQIDPLLEITYPKMPHITGYYLDKQSQFYLPDIVQSVESKISLLESVELTIGGFGYFRGDNPRVIFLNVQYPEALKGFSDAVAESLSKYYAPDDNLPFYPHMTVAKLITPRAQQSYEMTEPKLKLRLNEVNWTFPVTEVVLYGVDSTKKPEHQEKLIPIRL